ncbi:hypothetical protein HanIR_Chr01g0008331 [Helianthus annuus]|nr:hypothetical protein HanIR_Chr01g0008331 [Helianthus annuus]
MPPVPGKTRPCTRSRARQYRAGKTRVDQESNSRPFDQGSLLFVQTYLFCF